jgi:hypothetical protein
VSVQPILAGVRGETMEEGMNKPAVIVIIVAMLIFAALAVASA